MKQKQSKYSLKSSKTKESIRIKQKEEKEKEQKEIKHSILTHKIQSSKYIKDQCYLQFIITSNCELSIVLVGIKTLKPLKIIEIDTCGKYKLLHAENEQISTIQKDIEIIISTCIKEIMIQPNQINSYLVVNSRNEAVVKTTNAIMKSYLKELIGLIENEYGIKEIQIIVEYNIMNGNEIVGNYKEITQLITQRWEMILHEVVVVSPIVTFTKKMFRSINK